jgi:hypothetical protein
MKLLFATLLLLPSYTICAQAPSVKPCTTDAGYREFDFWIGDWMVFAPNGKQAGESHVELILDSCIIFENWKSAAGNYAGKSFNSYNSSKKQWKQNWVDDKGGGNDYTGSFANDKMVYLTEPFTFSKDTLAIRRMTFFRLGPDKVRQLGEISKDNSKTWAVEYDLEYRRRK